MSVCLRLLRLLRSLGACVDSYRYDDRCRSFGYGHWSVVRRRRRRRRQKIEIIKGRKKYQISMY